jgi:hypothetical protein
LKSFTLSIVSGLLAPFLLGNCDLQ